MKLNERRNQQCGCDKETKRDRKVLRKKKAAKAKHPRHHDNHLKLTRRVGFENFQREKKEPCDPAREIAKHRGECEQQRGGEPKQRSPWDSGIFPLLCAPDTPTLTQSHGRGPSSPWKRLNARMHR